MRKRLSLLILNLIISRLSYGQYPWINLNYKLKMTDTARVTSYKVQYLHDSANIKIYRTIKLNNSCDNDYSGFLYSQGGLKSQSGKMVLYYNNHQIKSKCNYLNGLQEGKWIEYFDNGHVDNQGEFVNGKKNSVWFWYFKNGQVSSKENYEGGKLVSVEMWDSTGQQVTNPDKVDRLPMLNKKDKDMMAFRKLIASNMRYPESAAEKNITGDVWVRFCIDEDGNLINEQVCKSVDKSLDEEALRVIQLCKKWIPAIQHNRVSKMSFTFPITFRIQ